MVSALVMVDNGRQGMGWLSLDTTASYSGLSTSYT
jgi:hypothetical protein